MRPAELLLPAALATGDPPPPPPPPEPERVRVVYMGGSGGVGSTKYGFDVLGQLQRRAAQVQIKEIRAFHGALAQGDWLLWAEDRSVASVVEALETGVGCQGLRGVTVATTGLDLLVLERPSAPAWLDDLPGDHAEWLQYACTAGQTRLTMLGPPGAAPADMALERWEFRRALTGRLNDAEGEAGFSIVGRPVQELTRDVPAIQAQIERGAIFVHAGDLLDGASSVSDGALSLHRPTDLLAAQRLGPTALVPAENELLAGPRAFLAEVSGAGLPWVATNWRAQDPALALPPSIVREVKTKTGSVRLAFLGVVDPELATFIPAIAADGVSLADPVPALNAEVERLRSSEQPPDAVLLLGVASDALRAQIRRQVRGVDVLIGDPTFATLRVSSDTVQLRSLPPTAKGAAITLPMDGIGILDLEVQSNTPVSLRYTPLLVPPEAPSDPELRARITRVRAEVYPNLDRPLLDNPAPAPLDAATWSALVCEAVRRSTQADTVLLGELPAPPRQPGPLSEMMVADALASLDLLEAHEIPGDRMADLLDKVYSVAPVSCGAKPGELYPRARGRLLEDGRTYRVVTTDRTRQGSLLDGILSSVESLRPLDQPTWRVIRREDGAPLTLRMAALDGLRTLRDARGGTDGLTTYITTQAPREVLPLWLLRLRTLSLTASRFQGVNDDAFASVPETLVTAPDSLLLDGGLDLALEHSSGRVEWDLRGRVDYGLLSYGGAEAEESADDGVLSTSLGLPRYAWPGAGPLRLMPYGELRLDSELTPTSGNARQEDLSALIGVSAVKSMNVRGLHLGVFAQEDLAQGGAPELGLRADVETFHLVSPALKVMTSADLQLYLPGSQDDASDVGLLTEGQLKLAMPLAHWLDLTPWAGGLLVRGRVPETEHLGVSWSAGVALEASAAFEM